MIRTFQKQIKDAIKERRSADFPKIDWLIPFIFIFTFLFCLLSVYVVPSNKPADFNFQEGGTITAMSAIFLTLACGFAIGANLVHMRVKGKQDWLWTILAFGFAFLAFDELLQFHERVDHLFERMMPNLAFQGWNDLFVILYGVLALPIMFVLLPGLLKYRKMLGLFVVAFIFYAIHTTIDSVQETATFTIVIFEESAKLFSVAFLAMGSLMGFVGNVWQYLKTDSKESLPAISKDEPLIPAHFETDVIHFAE